MSKAINARTTDHTVVEELVDQSKCSQSQSEVSPKPEIASRSGSLMEPLEN